MALPRLTDLPFQAPFQEDTSDLFPGPLFRIDLSSLDACHPLHYSRQLFIFRCDSMQQQRAQITALTAGLRVLVNRCPLLAGIIGPLDGHEAIASKPEWRTIHFSKGLEFLTRDISESMPCLDDLIITGFPAVNFPYDLLMPIPPDLTLYEDYPACKVQLSAINDGTILTFAMSHTVADGVGTDHLTRLLAEYTRLAQHQPLDMLIGAARNATRDAFVGEDRTPISSVTSKVPFNLAHHPAYMWNDLPMPPLANPPHHPFSSGATPEIPVLLHLSPEGLARLKLAATLPGTRISTHDALCAAMWRSVILIRTRRSPTHLNHLYQAHPHALSPLFMPMDARRHLGLSADYVGNAVYQLAASLEFKRLLDPNGLQFAAAAVRSAVNNATPEVIQSYLAEINEVEEPRRKLGWKYTETNANVVGLAMGTCLRSGDAIYRADWGEAFGDVVRFRLVSEAGTNCVMPTLRDGSVEIVLSVLPHEVATLKGRECFGEYLV